MRNAKYQKKRKRKKKKMGKKQIDFFFIYNIIM
jgi:hypothetical protein